MTGILQASIENRAHVVNSFQRLNGWKSTQLQMETKEHDMLPTSTWQNKLL